MNKLFFYLVTSILLSNVALASNNYECKMSQNNNEQREVCFPVGHACFDPHGIGDGNPIEVDCWTSGSRLCHNGSANWPTCAGGIVANTCKDVLVGSVEESVCFPAGHACFDLHGIGDGNPIEVDCWTSGSRLCHSGSANWPACAGGFLN